ncbi:putative membrane protein [Cedratvirus kamchatka]|uniref:Membrane protein n=1 Tax=Cedratvirus kamchatka TaxID=2716914 RepID=A0A6G8MYF1_9VIRU|nr:putative membrane protein [Cedratvirus kamchatka]
MLVIYLTSLILFFLLFYLYGLTWYSSLVLALLISLAIILLLFPGIANFYLMESILFITGLVVVLCITYFALSDKRT